MNKVKQISATNIVQDIETNYSHEGDKTFFLLNKYIPNTHKQYPTMVSTEIIGFVYGKTNVHEVETWLNEHNKRNNTTLSLLQFIKQEYGTKCDYDY